MKNILGSGMSRYRGSVVGKGLMSFLRNWKMAMWLKSSACLRWGWISRQGLPSHVWKTLRVLSRSGTRSDHSGYFWRMDRRGKNRIKRPVRRLPRWFWWQTISDCGDGEKWIYLRHNLEVILIGLGDCDVKREWKLVTRLILRFLARAAI